VQLIEQASPRFGFEHIDDVRFADRSVEQCGWRVVGSWPKAQFREVVMPDGLPEPIEDLLEHSQKAASRGGYDLSILGFVLALKMAKSTYSPEFKGSVRQWISALVEKGMLLSNIKTWIHGLKLSEEVVGASALLAEDYAAFVLTVLTQIFGMSSRSKGVAGGSR
jgi:hypothetical protein